jgi:hypothetical protein
MGEVKISQQGIEFSATYVVVEDTLIVGLPDGSVRTTELRGLEPASSALFHLKSYVSTARK